MRSICNQALPCSVKSLVSMLIGSQKAAFPSTPVDRRGTVACITITPSNGETIEKTCRRVAGIMLNHSETPVHVLAFGDKRAESVARSELCKSLGRFEWPLTWIEGCGCNGEPVAGMQVHMGTGEVHSIHWKGQVVGSVFEGDGARQCVIGAIMPEPGELNRGAQVELALETLQTIMEQVGFDLGDLVRTWFFLEDILSWYREFNLARTRVYSQIQFRTGSMPASTGVGAHNCFGSALALVSWAHRPLSLTSRAREVGSPLQCPATSYGSSFSRAMEMCSDSGRHLFISGTASIAPAGETLWASSATRQVEVTMEVVESLLASRQMLFSDLVSATAYFRRPADAQILKEWLRVNNLSQLPVVLTQCDICRDDLLFEIEAEAHRHGP